MKSLLHLYSENELIKAAKRDSLNQPELYILDTFNSASKLLNTLESLDMIIKCLTKFHPEFNKNFNVEKMTKNDADEIQYHIENFYVRPIKIKDQILLFTNQLIDLKLQNQKCNYKNIYKAIKNKIVNENFHDSNGIKILQLIKDLQNKFKKVENYRNFITHRGEYINEDLHLIGTVLYFKELEKGGDYPKSLFKNQMPVEDFENILKVFLSKTIMNFRNNANVLNDWTFSFFKLSDSILKQIYKKKAETLTKAHTQ